MIKIGDTIMCISNGGNNTDVGISGNVAKKGDGPFKIITIYEGGVYSSSCGMNTLKTECGKFLWNSTELYEIIENKEPNYEIY